MSSNTHMNDLNYKIPLAECAGWYSSEWHHSDLPPPRCSASGTSRFGSGLPVSAPPSHAITNANVIDGVHLVIQSHLVIRRQIELAAICPRIHHDHSIEIGRGATLPTQRAATGGEGLAIVAWLNTAVGTAAVTVQRVAVVTSLTGLDFAIAA